MQKKCKDQLEKVSYFAKKINKDGSGFGHNCRQLVQILKRTAHKQNNQRKKKKTFIHKN